MQASLNRRGARRPCTAFRRSSATGPLRRSPISWVLKRRVKPTSTSMSLQLARWAATAAKAARNTTAWSTWSSRSLRTSPTKSASSSDSHRLLHIKLRTLAPFSKLLFRISVGDPRLSQSRECRTRKWCNKRPRSHRFQASKAAIRTMRRSAVRSARVMGRSNHRGPRCMTHLLLHPHPHRLQVPEILRQVRLPTAH